MQETDLLGIPIPSDDPQFVAIIICHIILSLIVVTSGLIAMLKDKGSGGHTRFGRIFYWSYIASFATVTVLAIMRWPHNNHLMAIGLFAVVLILFGKAVVKNKRGHWARLHTICMSSSYILLLTGFYVDNGKNLPFWNQFPQWFFWTFPSTIGIPILLYVLKKNPLLRPH